MDLVTFLLVLGAALVHATWNFWLKKSGSQMATMAMMSAGWALVALLALPVVGLPADGAWPYLIASTFVHVIYQLTLTLSYQVGDFSTAYPIARGVAPLLVTAVALIFFGEQIGTLGLLAVAMIVLGILGLGIRRAIGNDKGLYLSLLTGLLIATYSIIDGLGGRVDNSPHAYAAWLFLLSGIAVPATIFIVFRHEFDGLTSRNWLKHMSAGAIAVGGYWIAIWAMSVAPMGLVAAVRETSVAFAGMLGAIFLKEKVRWGYLVLVAIGVILIRIGS